MVVLGRRVPIGKLIKTTVQTVVFFLVSMGIEN